MNGNSGPTRHEKYLVLIVDAQPLVRDGLRQLINAQSDLECCGEAGTQAAALDLIASQKPDLVTIDICLHNGDGLELLKKLRAQYPLLLTLIITQYDESIFAERALKAGACGYVMKDHDADEVLTAIRTVLKGQIYASPQVAVIALNKMSGLPARRGHPIHRLSDRELQVLQLLGAGLPNRKVAEKLFLSVKTVEAHRENIKHKLGVANAVELIRFAAEWVAGQTSQW